MPDLTEAEWLDLTSHAKARAARFDSEIANRLAANDLRGAKHKSRKMLTCRAVCLHALIRENAKARSVNRLTPRELLALLPSVSVFARRASPTLRWMRKREGGLRPIVKFGLVDGACAALIAMVLRPFARAHPQRACHPAQVMLAGGPPVACERLRVALEQAPAEAVFVQIDVRRFFQSIACSELARMTGLPPEVIHRHLSMEHLKVHRWKSPPDYRGMERSSSEYVASAPSGAECESGSPSGLATGSAASSFVAEIVMGHILRAAGDLQGLIALIAYSDNIGAVVQSREAALVLKEAILRALRRSEAGPFEAGRVTMNAITDGFDFLGYHWRVLNGSVVAVPERRRHHYWTMRFGTDLLQMGFSAQPTSAAQPHTRLRAYANSKWLWGGREAFVADWEQRIAEMIPDGSSDPTEVMAPA
ncbi:hypothetical protein [Brevundimonas bacteroides]|uniref:hypothetical protein n=1 Tax=Brevundimonas bacteroides TaxID=74311 RepID=UPI00049809E3|nr:hypothetical protein [Brevundimonas bacteroides]